MGPGAACLCRGLSAGILNRSMQERAVDIKLERLTLRRAVASDLDAIHEIMSDAETMRYWSTLPYQSNTQTARWLEGMIVADPDRSDDFIVEHYGKVIGKLGAWQLPEIGFFLHRDYWGRGLAREALDGFIRYMRDRQVPLLTADVDPLNISSLKLLKAADFIETGSAKATFIIGDRVCDSVYLAHHLEGP